ncbi:unnamed protein product [Durusdinium trenchii]|uniref:Uncharacterized protein n=1 Tax=Durusdinium trenchii TaxID=1381693 RepID=A0ABP0HYQ9_9DINO
MASIILMVLWTGTLDLSEENWEFDCVEFYAGKGNLTRMMLAVASILKCAPQRTIHLLLLVTALGGVWGLEQPNSSCLGFYPAFREFLTVIMESHGSSAVTRVAWWMGHYLAPTPKRHFAYSNSMAMNKLDKGVLSGWKKRKNKANVKTAVTYIDKSGKKRYKGTPALRATEIYPLQFGREMVDIFPHLIASARGQPRLPAVIPAAAASFQSLPSEDAYSLGFAKLQTTFDYLRRGRHLLIPKEWEGLIPKPS